MIIRSQNKHRITTDLDIWMEHRKIGTKEEYWICNKTMSVLGRYSTAEKATKVLDMIQSAYEESNSVCTMSGFVANTVFQMPQDSEV